MCLMANRYSMTILSPLGFELITEDKNLAFEAFGTQFRHFAFKDWGSYTDKYREPIYLDRPLTIFE